MSRCQVCGVSVGRAGRDGIVHRETLPFPGVRYDGVFLGMWDHTARYYACGDVCRAELKAMIGAAKTLSDPTDWLTLELLNPVESEPPTEGPYIRWARDRLERYGQEAVTP